MRLEIIRAAEQHIADAITNATPLQIGGFVVGDTAGFTPTEQGASVAGTAVYTGAQVRYNVIGPDEVTFVIILEHDLLEEFTVGNIMINFTDGTPFVWAVLEEPLLKTRSNATNNVVGERLIFHFNVWHPGLTSGVDLSNLSVYRAEFYVLDSAQDVESEPYNQFILESHAGEPNPVFVFMETDQRVYGLGFFRSVTGENYGVIDGGEVGRS